MTPQRQPTRRQLLAGRAGTRPRSAPRQPPAPQEVKLITDLASVELLGMAVLGRALQAPALGPDGRALARRILAQEQAHLEALNRVLAGAGQPLPRAPLTPSAVDQALSDRHVGRQLEDLHSANDWLDMLLDAEGVAEGAYYGAMSHLHTGGLIELAAGILANEAQHEALLGRLRKPKNLDRATPYPFVQGTQ